ncbi:MAG: hypothetical protein GY894_03575 [Planctomycetes bacterium]|nr:hypothetical protein [Planctomycetota bacterium]MCP4838429.1 hypothetical protein [Planctomycetota bacterium]
MNDRYSVASLLVLVVVGGMAVRAQSDQTQVPTTAEDFYQPGSQPLPAGLEPFSESWSCSSCHNFTDDDNPDAVTSPFFNWAGTMMAQSARDPVWQAAVIIASQDAAGAGEYCIRCHSPTGWAGGRSTSGDLDDLWDPDDFDGVNCAFCHRLVDPISSNENPAQDSDILQALIDDGTYPDPAHPGNGRFIFDPEDDRRGPLDDVGINMHGAAQIVHSPHHSEASICASCHDLGNPVFSWNEATESFELNDMDAAHPTQNTYHMFPEQRTYSEWLNSEFASSGVAFPDGRFGGDGHPDGVMKSCQDCHMPKTHGANCSFWYLPEIGSRDDIDVHSFAGGNTWVVGAVHDLWDSTYTGLTDEIVNMSMQRTADMLAAASDMDVSQNGSQLDIRVTNWSGHKLPTGMPEGRRMWLNIEFHDVSGAIIEELGDYNWIDASLDEASTHVWEARLGVSQTIADATGVDTGESYHLVLCDHVVKDNRIPPVGFTNAAFEAIHAAPVGATYVDGQHWSDTAFEIPAGAVDAVVTMYFQTTTRDMMEFLRDANVTDDRGQIAWDAYVARGMSPPVVMDATTIELDEVAVVPGDVNGDGVVTIDDLLELLSQWGPCTGCSADLNGDGEVSVDDLLELLSHIT